MTGTNHGLTGAVIALTLKQPALALPLAFASHFACDALPHFGFDNKYIFTKRFNIVLAADFVLAVSLMIVIALMHPANLWLVWACMILAASPDLMWLYYHGYIKHYKKQEPVLGPLARFHAWIQWSQTTPGAALEVIWFVLMGVVIGHLI